MRVIKSPKCEYCAGSERCVVHNNLTTSDREAFMQERVTRTYEKGDILFFEGADPTGLYMLCSGQVKITKTNSEGKSIISRIALAGDMVGYRSLLAGTAYGGTAEVAEPSVITHVRRQYVEKVLKDQRELSFAMLQQLARDLGVAESKTLSVAYEDAQHRILHTLSDLATTRKAANGTVATDPIHVLRQDISQLCGLTLETTSRALKKMETEGLVELGARTITLTDAGFEALRSA